MTKTEIIQQFRNAAADKPYHLFLDELYNADSLYCGYQLGSLKSFTESFDAKVYAHYIRTGKGCNAPEDEMLARVLHDCSVSRLMRSFLANYSERTQVGVMGGHGLLRTDKGYRDIVYLSKRLTEEGFLMITGGGPGAMEATHLGAWMAGRSREDVAFALDKLSIAPTFQDERWLDTALVVMKRFPQTKYKSLGIPTWLYGHEPATPFATHIAKFFDNSIREDTILTVAYGGIIYTAGSAGTVQEIFQDATQNHYKSLGYSSPMIFYGNKFWTEEMPIYSLLDGLMGTGRYKNLLLHLTEDDEEIVKIIKEFSKTDC